MNREQIVKAKYQQLFITMYDVMTFDLVCTIKAMEREELSKIKKTNWFSLFTKKYLYLKSKIKQNAIFTLRPKNQRS